jgi:zinc D-Ala-D-Ala carboxypeptidase
LLAPQRFDSVAGMEWRARSAALTVILMLTASCVPPSGGSPRAAMSTAPYINPLPIPDAPAPRIRTPISEPAEIGLLVDDDALAGAICRDQARLLPPAGTLFGHQRFDEPATAALTAPPTSATGGSCQQVHVAMAAPMQTMIEAATAEDASVGRAIVAISCYRSIERQAALFCDRGRVRSRGYAGQARWIAPPGYSEHATGLSIDFGSRSEEGCNLRPCFASTAVGRWLSANAWRFGFELSFPAGNAQGVSYEPWHFRYVGTAAARRLFNQTSGPADSPA